MSQTTTTKHSRNNSNNNTHGQMRRGLNAHLSDDLSGRYRMKSVPIRVGDTVRVIRGDFVGLEGKVDRVYPSRGRVSVEGMTREKTAGVSSKLTVHASKVILTNLVLSDKWRSSSLDTKAKMNRDRERAVTASPEAQEAETAETASEEEA